MDRVRPTQNLSVKSYDQAAGGKPPIYYGRPVTKHDMAVLAGERWAAIDVLCRHLGWEEVTPKDSRHHVWALPDGRTFLTPREEALDMGIFHNAIQTIVDTALGERGK